MLFARRPSNGREENAGVNTAREKNGFGKDETDVMNDTAEIEDRDTPRIVTSAKLAGMIGTRPSNFIRTSGQTAAPSGRTSDREPPEPSERQKKPLLTGAVHI
jgi:hypothetical protein